MPELNGRDSEVFTVTISERQFQFKHGDEVFAESSSMSTFLAAMSQMFAICGKGPIEFQIKDK